MSLIKRSTFLLDSPYLSNRFDKLATSLIGQEQRRDERRERIKKAIEEAYKEQNYGKTKRPARKHGRRKQGKAQTKHGGGNDERAVDGGAGASVAGEKAENESGDRVFKDTKR